MVVVALAAPGLRGAVGAAIYWWWGPTYRQVEFVMDEAAPNEGVPLIRGRIEPGGEAAVVPATLTGTTFAVAAEPGTLFAPGRRLRVWSSPSAPIVGLGGARSTQLMPVSALPRLPGLLSLIGYLVLAALPFVGGVLVVRRLRIRSLVYQGGFALGGEPYDRGARGG